MVIGDKAITRDEMAMTSEEPDLLDLKPEVPEDVPRLPETEVLVDDKNLSKNLHTVHVTAKQSPSAIGGDDEDYEAYAAQIEAQRKIVAGATKKI